MSTSTILLGTGVFLLISSIFLFFVGPEFIQSRLYEFESNERGPAGDAFNGILGPVIAWIAAILTFAAFYIQYEANQQQRKKLEEQSVEVATDRFENKYFELIRLHRANVDEMNIQDLIKQRKVFIPMFYEFRYIYYLAEKYYKEFEKQVIEDNDKIELINIAYLLFFFGVGYNSDKTHTELFEKYLQKQFYLKLVEELKKTKSNYKQWHQKTGDDGKIKISSSEFGEIVFKVKYKPFNGHSEKLGHYFRHLFQAVKFIDEQTGKYFTPDVKYKYVKTLRAQLSNFEQLLLYYNHLSVIGHPWKKFLKDYHLIKNIPLPYADFGVAPQDFFKNEIEEVKKRKDGKEFFEWFEIKNLITTNLK